MSLTPEGADARRLARKPIPKPKPAYLPTAGSPLSVDEDLYARIRDAPRLKSDEFVIPIRSGRAWKAEAGCIIRISTPEGAQVGMSIYILHSPFQSNESEDLYDLSRRT